MARYEPFPESVQANDYSEDEIDLRILFSALWRGKWLIIGLTTIFGLGGAIYALSKPDIYSASVLLAPANDEGSMSGIQGQLGGLASLAGINLNSGSSGQTALAKEVLRTRAFLKGFIERRDLAVPIIAGTSWNEKTGEWEYNQGVYDPRSGQWLLDEKGGSMQPTDWDLVNDFRNNHLGLSENQESGLLTLTVRSPSPEAAKTWAQWLVQDINEHMRKEDVARSEARIAYLESKLSDTHIAGMQQVFYQLIESEMRTVMLANAQKEYVFKTIDPAVAPQEPSEPKRALIVALAILLGGMLGVFLVLVRAFFEGNLENENQNEPDTAK